MGTLVFALEIIGVVGFAIAGAMVGIQKGLDVFGICILGVTTAVGGGVVRDLLLGNVPPAMFENPVYAAVGLFTVVLLWIPAIRKAIKNTEKVLFIADAIGLGIFSSSGTIHAIVLNDANIFLACFVGVVTGVGGGLIRDVMANVPPYIFTRHIYATASITGSLATCFIYQFTNQYIAMFVGAGIVVAIRIMASLFKWNLPTVPSNR